MQDALSISCPVSAERINENVARTAAFIVIITTVASLVTGSYIPMVILAIDFALRAFTSGDISPVKLLSRQIVNLLNISPKPVDAAPKKFAAGVGMVFCAAIAVFQLSGLDMFAYITGGVLLICALLEGAAAICVGCIVYTMLVLPFIKNK